MRPSLSSCSSMDRRDPGITRVYPLNSVISLSTRSFKSHSGMKQCKKIRSTLQPENKREHISTLEDFGCLLAAVASYGVLHRPAAIDGFSCIGCLGCLCNIMQCHSFQPWTRNVQRLSSSKSHFNFPFTPRKRSFKKLRMHD